MEKWTELRTAFRVAKLGTVSAAAVSLGYHRATVNRHIDALEEELGAPIFIRHAKGYTPTELGEEVLRVAHKAEELIEDLAGRAAGIGNQIEGEIKITLLAPFAGLLMEPVARFRAENPNCRTEFIVSEDLARLEYGEAHIALRVGAKPDHPDYVVTHFRKIRLNLYAHESYIRRKGMPRDQDDLGGHEFAFHPEEIRRMPLAAWISDHVLPSQIAVSSRHIGVSFQSVLAGLGMGFLSDADVVDRTDLHPVLPANEDWHVDLWLVTHVDLHRTNKVQTMLRHIRAA